jgi:ABC-2 type transport system ATP-binding protein
MAKNKAPALHTYPISIQGLSKTFDDKCVLNDVSLTIKQGSIFGLVGLNGTGKTTMIKTLLGLLDADTGSISIFGHAPGTIQARESYSYLPEKFIPSPYLKGREFLSLTLSYYHKPFNENEAVRMAKAIDLEPAALEKKITHYSKGMAQKLGLISALMIEAPLLILDEPMSGLDPRARIHLKEALLNYVRKGSTIFFTSHILSDIEEICTDTAIIHDQGIIFEGAPKEFRQKFGGKGASLERAFLKAIGS